MISDIIGIGGVILVLLAYFLLQTGAVRSDDIRYPVINLVGACMILVSLLRTFNLASFIIEICWIAISVYGIVRIVGARRKA